MTPPADGSASAEGRLLLDVLRVVDDLGIRWCILHGYKTYPADVPSDVDILLEGDIRSNVQRLSLALPKNKLRIFNALQHESSACYAVIGREDAAGPFLRFDASSDFRRDGRVFLDGDTILASRRHLNGFWVPAPDVEFIYYLSKRLAKSELTQAHGQRLTELFHEAPAACSRRVEQALGPAASGVVDAARTGAWGPAMRDVRRLRSTLLRNTRGPANAAYAWQESRRLASRLLHATGYVVAFLGPDGSGKSSVLGRVERDLSPLFRRVARHHLRPGRVRSRRPQRPADQPHAEAPRGRLASAAKLALWTLDYWTGHLVDIQPARARSTLVLFDRYFDDLAVDQRRYRFRGPSWLVSASRMLIPGPDLYVLLDVEPETAFARKPELTLDELRRQREAYRRLAFALPNVATVDASRPLEEVVGQVERAILDRLAARTLRRFAA